MDSLMIYLLVALFLSWSVWYIKNMLKVFNVHLKYLFEPDVNEMAKYEVGARYDAVNLKYSKWRVIIWGLFLAPVRIVLFLSIISISNAFVG